MTETGPSTTHSDQQDELTSGAAAPNASTRLPSARKAKTRQRSGRPRLGQTALERFLILGVGVAFLIVVLVLAMREPNPTAFQYWVYKVILALGSGAFAAFIPGLLNVNLHGWVKAGGALAIMVIVFDVAPVPPPVQAATTRDQEARAFLLGTEMHVVKAMIDQHISYKNGTGAFDDMADQVYVNTKMNVIRDLEYLEFNRRDEISMFRTRNLNEWEATNDAWELVSRVEGYLERRSRKLVLLFGIGFAADQLHSQSTRNPPDDVTAWTEQLMRKLASLEGEDRKLGKAIREIFAQRNGPYPYAEFEEKVLKYFKSDLGARLPGE